MVFLPLSIIASHNRGGEITYLHLGGLTYQFTITTCTDLGSLTNTDREELAIDFDLGTTHTQFKIQFKHLLNTNHITSTKLNGEFLLSLLNIYDHFQKLVFVM